MNNIGILIADDHAVVREGLRSLLELDGEFTVLGEAADGRDAVRLVEELRPQVVLMDIAMPQLNGFEATRRILDSHPSIKVIALSAYSDDEYVAHMAELGAMGYVAKGSSGRVLLQAIREVVKGRPFFSSAVAMRLQAFARLARQAGCDSSVAMLLTQREAEVLQLVAEGAPNKRIASILGISIKTVEKHRQQLMDKLNIHDTAGLTRHAIATGVIESSSQKEK